MNLDAVEGELRSRDQPGSSGASPSPVPPGNQPKMGEGAGSKDQDKPDLDKFAAKLGMDDDARSSDEGSRSGKSRGRLSLRRERNPVVFVLLGGASAVGTAIGVVRAVRRMVIRPAR